MVTIDRWFFSLRLLSQGQLRWSPSSRDSTLLSCPQSDHDLRGDSATEYQQSCSKLAESGSIILTAHSSLQAWPVGARISRFSCTTCPLRTTFSNRVLASFLPD